MNRRLFHHQPARRQGFFLMELMVGLVLIGAVATIATSTMLWAMRLTVQARHAHDEAMEFDNAIARMRADAWEARSLQATSSVATLDSADGQTIVWHIAADGTLVRQVHAAPGTLLPTGDISPSTWTAAAPGLQFSSDGRTLDVSVPDDRATARLVLPNQLALTGRGQ